MSISEEISVHSPVCYWHSINWKQCHQIVRRQQTRIAKAAKDGKWRRVKLLQRLLVHSLSARKLAVRRVTENAGKRTPGVDGETWSTPEAKMNAVQQLTPKGYKPKPLKRCYIPKANGKQRPLGIPCMVDRAMQALWLLALEPVSETTADRNSYGFRPLRSTTDALQQLHNNLARPESAQWVMEGDIRACFDNISHDWLLKNIPIDRIILRKWLKAGYMENKQLHSTNAGTPQGGPISPVLANMALDGLEKVVVNYFGAQGGVKARKHKVNYVRYADDWVISGASQETMEILKPVIIRFLTERGLSLSPEKTKVTHIDDGFDFLGQNIRKYKGKYLSTPAVKNRKALLNKVKNIFDANKTTTAWKVILQLNPVLRGWANYHRHAAAKRSFNYVDHRVWEMTWQWCKRRHPNKGKRWIADKYFTRIKNRNWIFFCDPTRWSASDTGKNLHHPDHSSCKNPRKGQSL